MKVTKISVKLVGLASLVFHKFIDHSKEVRPPEQHIYLDENNTVVIPASNIMSFLTRKKKPFGCAKVFEGRRGESYCQIVDSHVIVRPDVIPILNGDEKEIVFQGFDAGWDILKEAGTVQSSSGGNTIKQEIYPRPMLLLPWALRFEIDLIENRLINQAKLRNWFEAGGLIIALGNYRPRYGRFYVEEWIWKEEEIS